MGKVSDKDPNGGKEMSTSKPIKLKLKTKKVKSSSPVYKVDSEEEDHDLPENLAGSDNKSDSEHDEGDSEKLKGKKTRKAAPVFKTDSEDENGYVSEDESESE